SRQRRLNPAPRGGSIVADATGKNFRACRALKRTSKLKASLTRRRIERRCTNIPSSDLAFDLRFPQFRSGVLLEEKYDRRLLARPALRRANVDEAARLYVDSHNDAGARHRLERGALQRGECGHPAPASVQGTRPPGSTLAARPAPGRRRYSGLE